VLAVGRASSTVKKERAAINSWLRWLVEFGHIPAEQARAALAIKLPRAQQAEREQPKSLSAEQYDQLLRAARAAIVDEPLAGARDLVILLVLGDAGCAARSSPDWSAATFSPRRAGGKLRALNVRHGRATAAAPSSSPSARRARSCAGNASAPASSARPPTTHRCSSRSAAADRTAATAVSAGAAASPSSPR
jgi:plasmid stabilization system protein ParE